MERINSVNLNDRVYWVDPEGLTSDWYDVISINGFKKQSNVDEEIKADYFDWEDAIIGLDNGFSYAEVYLNELRK